MANINDSLFLSKEAEQTFRPTYLYKVNLTDGNQLCFGSVNIGQNATDPGAYFLTDYYNAVVAGERLTALQSSGTMGIDAFGAVSVDLSDADGRWSRWEGATGFAGATMHVLYVMFDAATGNFTPDSLLVFVGQCDSGTRAGELLTVNATSNYSTNKQTLPPTPVQRLCPNTFPTNGQERFLAANDQLSVFWNCGYSPGEFAGVGNLAPNGQPYTSCSYTKASCNARGLYGINGGGAGRRFAGCQWQPPATWKGNSYTAGRLLQGVNTENLPKYKKRIPITFGKTWVTGVCDNVVGDPNTTWSEVMLGWGWYHIDTNEWPSKITILVVNGLRVPHATQTSDLQFRWVGITDGNRQGFPTPAAIYNSAGDPHGNILTIFPAVYQTAQNSNTPMNVQALLEPRPIPVYSSPGVYTFQPTVNLAWTVLEVLRLTRPDLYSAVDIQSVIDYANVCDGVLSFIDINNNPAVRNRYHVAFALMDEATASQVLEGLKLAGRLLIVPDPFTGRLRFLGKQSLCDQQPTPVRGSNNDSPIASWASYDDANGGPSASGHLAYDFDETNVVPGSFRFMPPSIQSIPNVLIANIQDEFNNYTPDTVTVAAPGAVAISQQKLQTVVPALGLPNYDQAYCVLNGTLAELWTGNPRRDWKGSWVIQFQTSFRACHLFKGQIIRFKMDKLAFLPQTYRIEGIAPTQGGQRITITARWHDDRWYCNNFGHA